MAEGKGVFFLVWVKSGFGSPDSFQLYCLLCAVKICLAKCFDCIFYIFYFELLDFSQWFNFFFYGIICL